MLNDDEGFDATVTAARYCLLSHRSHFQVNSLLHTKFNMSVIDAPPVLLLLQLQLQLIMIIGR